MVLIRQASTQSPPLTALLAEWPQSNENKSNWPRHLPTPMKVGVKNTKYKNLSLMKTRQIGPDSRPLTTESESGGESTSDWTRRSRPFP